MQVGPSHPCFHSVLMRAGFRAVGLDCACHGKVSGCQRECFAADLPAGISNRFPLMYVTVETPGATSDRSQSLYAGVQRQPAVGHSICSAGNRSDAAWRPAGRQPRASGVLHRGQPGVVSRRPLLVHSCAAPGMSLAPGPATSLAATATCLQLSSSPVRLQLLNKAASQCQLAHAMLITGCNLQTPVWHGPQAREDVPGPLSRWYRHISKGAWPFSTRDHGWPISDCTSEGMRPAVHSHPLRASCMPTAASNLISSCQIRW